MDSVLSTKLTQSGQTTVPVEVRKRCGIPDGGRVYWIEEDGRTYISATPEPPLTVHSAEEFWNRIAESEGQYAKGRFLDAEDASSLLRKRHGL